MPRQCPSCFLCYLPNYMGSVFWDLWHFVFCSGRCQVSPFIYCNENIIVSNFSSELGAHFQFIVCFKTSWAWYLFVASLSPRSIFASWFFFFCVCVDYLWIGQRNKSSGSATKVHPQDTFFPCSQLNGNISGSFIRCCKSTSLKLAGLYWFMFTGNLAHTPSLVASPSNAL